MSCLFRSLASFIHNLNESRLREMIVDYLATDPFMFRNPDQRLSEILQVDNITLEQYVHHMRNEGTWGGAIEIRAFADMFHASVVVHMKPTKKIIEFHPNNSTESKNQFTIVWDGGHYEPQL